MKAPGLSGMLIGEQHLVYDCTPVVRCILESNVTSTGPVDWWQLRQHHVLGEVMILHKNEAAQTLPKWIEIA